MKPDSKLSARIIVKYQLPEDYANSMAAYAMANPYYDVKVHLRDIHQDSGLQNIEFHMRNVAKPTAQRKLIHFVINWAAWFFTPVNPES